MDKFAIFQKILSDLRRLQLVTNSSWFSKYLNWAILPLYRQARVIFLVRLGTEELGLVSRIARMCLRSWYLIEIGKNVRIGDAIFFPHPHSIVIGEGCRIGNFVSIAQFVTIGGNFRKTQKRTGYVQKLPEIGSFVTIGPGAVIGGPVQVGDNAIVGANATVTRDVPPNKIAYGQNNISRRSIIVDPRGFYNTIEGQ